MWPWGKEDPADDAASATAAHPSTTPASTTATQSSDARQTRSQTTSSPNTNFLSLPNRKETPRERLRRIRTPSPRPAEEPAFDFAATAATMDEATVQRIMEAAMRATQSSTTQSIQSLKKPDLPAFDKNNIEIWIKRVESAYIRVNITDAKIKFAHLESKFSVGEDPKVDSFLYGDATDANWAALLAYFRKRYGKTKKERASILLSGIPRNGKTPSQLAAALNERVGDITIDDLKKEQLLRQLPLDVHKQIVDKVDTLDFMQTAQLADKWFTQDGRPLLQEVASSVNSISQPPPTPSNTSPTATAAAAPSIAAPPTNYSAPFSEDTDVNAVRFQNGRKQHFSISNGSSNPSRGRGSGGSNTRGHRGSRGGRGGNGGSSNTNSYGESSSLDNNTKYANCKNVCHFHIKFGEEAQRCEPWCILNPVKGKASR